MKIEHFKKVSLVAKNLESKIGINFSNKNLLREALTHRSYLNENPDWDVPHNERLEFLGDAVLELAATEYLFSEYPNSSEGELTSIRAALVNYQMLSKLAKEISIEHSVLLSKGGAKETDRAKDVILANTFEAIIGAIYLDQGYEKSAEFVKKFVLSALPEVMDKKLYRDPKSLLQEIAQEKMKITPHYIVISETGPDHEKVFETAVYIGENQIAIGKGFSKQESEVEAAKNALEKLNQQ